MYLDTRRWSRWHRSRRQVSLGWCVQGWI